MATCVDVLALDERGEVQLDSSTEVLGVGHTQLALVVHLSLLGRREGGKEGRREGRREERREGGRERRREGEKEGGRE